MATITKSTGSRQFLGYAAEDPENPGVPVAATDYVPIDAKGTKLKEDPKRTAMEEVTGGLYVETFTIDEDGMVGGDTQFYLRPDWGMKLLFLAGFFDVPSGGQHVGSLTIPKPVTLEMMRAGQSFQYAGMYATKIKIASNGKSSPLVTITWTGISKRVFIDPTTPVYTPAGDTPFAWKNFQSATLLGGGAGATSIDSFEIDADMRPAEFRGNSGTGLPSDILPVGPSISVKLDRLFKDIVEFTQFADHGDEPGLVVFGWSKGSGSSQRSVSLSMPYATYTMDEHDGDVKSPLVEKITVKPLSDAGAVPLVLSVLNSNTSAYTNS